MKYQLEKIQRSAVIYNNYADIKAHSFHSKKLLSRTQSEPLQESKRSICSHSSVLAQKNFPNEMICFEHLFAVRASSKFDKRQTFAADLQASAEEQMEQVPSKQLPASVDPQQLPVQHSGSKVGRKAEASFWSHRRCSSITEKELKKILPRLINNEQEKPVGLDFETSVICRKAIQITDLFNKEAITRQPDERRGIVFQQPRPSMYVEKQSQEMPKHRCYNCLQRFKDAARCLTCMWCLDAACYHCYKDDVGYSSWFEEMITCQDRKTLKRNCKKWSLLGLVTVLLPCVLVYPVVERSLNLCMRHGVGNRTQDD